MSYKPSAVSLRKIVHVTFDMKIGGAEQVIQTLVENTDPERFDVSVLCIEPEIGPFGQKLREKGYSVECLQRRPGFDLHLIADVRRYIIDNSVDVLHCHQYTPFVYGVLGAVFTPTKVVFTEHGRFYPDCRKFKRVLVNPLLARMTHRITAISEATRRALRDYENMPINRIQLIYNGIDGTCFAYDRADQIKQRKLLGIPPEALVMGTVARLDPIKNHPLMLSALKRVLAVSPQTYLLVVGDGPESERLESMSRKLGISDRVIVTGFRNDTHHMYAVMDIFLLTSFSEGTAMTLLEAMATGLPCIVTNVGGNPEIVGDGKTGFVIPSNDCDALVEKIAILKGNPTLRTDLGRAALSRFLERFTARQMTATYENIYKQL